MEQDWESLGRAGLSWLLRQAALEVMSLRDGHLGKMQVFVLPN